MLHSPVQISMHVIIAIIFSQVNQNPCSTAAISGPTEAAVTDPSAWWALPLLTRNNEISQMSPTYTHNQMWRKSFRDSPNLAEHLGPPLRSGYEGRGHRTDPSLPHTLGYGSWFWCRLFSGGTGGKWTPENKRKKCASSTKRSWQNRKSFQHYGASGTYSRAVVHFLSHVVADVLQL